MTAIHAFALTLPHGYLLMALLIAISAFLQGVGGVGFTLFAAPVAVMVSPELVPGPLLTLGFFVTLLTALRERRAIQWKSASCMVAGRVAGAVLAVLALGFITRQSFDVVFAILIIAAVAISISGIKLKPEPKNALVAGALSGLMGTLTSVGAPPLALVMQYSKPAVIRATIGATLAVGALVSIGLLAFAGHYHWRDLVLSLTLLPFLLLGFVFSNRVRHLVAGKLLRRGLLLFCTLSAAGLLLKTTLVG